MCVEIYAGNLQSWEECFSQREMTARRENACVLCVNNGTRSVTYI